MDISLFKEAVFFNAFRSPPYSSIPALDNWVELMHQAFAGASILTGSKRFLSWRYVRFREHKDTMYFHSHGPRIRSRRKFLKLRSSSKFAARAQDTNQWSSLPYSSWLSIARYSPNYSVFWLMGPPSMGMSITYSAEVHVTLREVKIRSSRHVIRPC